MDTRSREDYFKVALDLLPEGGFAAITIANLCDRLGVTKGSFYYHFANGESFVKELLEHWEIEYGSRLGKTAVQIPDQNERLVAMREMSLELHHSAESAIRAFARSNHQAAEVLDRVDAARVELTRRTLVELGIEEPDAILLAKMVVSMLVGMQHLPRLIDEEERRAIFRLYQRAIRASAPPPATD